MQVNRIVPARGLRSVRELIESFEGDKLALPALAMKLPDGSYWRLSYGELQEHVRALGEALLALGVGRGDRIGLIAENRSEWIITYLAVTATGAVIVPFDVLIKPEELAPIVRSSGARIVFTSASYLDRLAEVRRLTASTAKPDAVEKVVLFDDPGAGTLPFSIAAFRDVIARGRELLAQPAPRYRAIRVRARGPRGPHLHLGDDGGAQGGHAFAREHHDQRRRRADDHEARAGR